jgi:hypothetical protein
VADRTGAVFSLLSVGGSVVGRRGFGFGADLQLVDGEVGTLPDSEDLGENVYRLGCLPITLRWHLLGAFVGQHQYHLADSGLFLRLSPLSWSIGQREVDGLLGPQLEDDGTYDPSLELGAFAGATLPAGHTYLGALTEVQTGVTLYRSSGIMLFLRVVLGWGNRLAGEPPLPAPTPVPGPVLIL